MRQDNLQLSENVNMIVNVSSVVVRFNLADSNTNLGKAGTTYFPFGGNNIK